MSDRPGQPCNTDTLPLSSMSRVSSPSGGTPGSWVLFVAHRDGIDAHRLERGSAAVIGRDSPADIVVEDTSISRRHATVQVLDDSVVVSDLGSTNGVYHRGARVERATLGDGEQVRLGAVVLSVSSFSGARSQSTGLVGHDRFLMFVEQELVRAEHFKRAAAVVMLEHASKSNHGPIAALVPLLERRLRPVDKAGLFAAGTVELLLPEVGCDGARSIALEIARAYGDKVVASVAAFPESGTSAEALIDGCRRAMSSAHSFGGVSVAPSAGLGHSVSSMGDSGPVLTSPPMQTLFETVTRVARSVIPILLYGETGSGKEVVARCIHDKSPRASGPIVSVNCAAIPSSLVESTLFGHEKGAFTGAVAQHKGVFEAAHGGTVFLDEIGELPLAVQAALLRALETKRVMRVGSTKEIAVDARVVAATHRNLEEMIEKGAFRADLFYRLNTVTLTVPPLRDRSEDIEPLAHRFLEQANRHNGTSVRAIDDDAMTALRAHGWPGNVRELRNVMERAVVVAASDVITLDDLPDRVRHAVDVSIRAPVKASAEQRELDEKGPLPVFKDAVREVEERLLLEALERARWSQTGAARLLQMPLRTLINKMKAYGIAKTYSGSGKAGAITD